MLPIALPPPPPPDKEERKPYETSGGDGGGGGGIEVGARERVEDTGAWTNGGYDKGSEVRGGAKDKGGRSDPAES